MIVIGERKYTVDTVVPYINLVTVRSGEGGRAYLARLQNNIETLLVFMRLG